MNATASVAAYINSSNGIRGGKVHSSVFMPRGGTSSVFAVDGLSEEEIWKIGLAHVIQSGRTLYGRGQTVARTYYNAGLQLLRDDTPKFHVNVTGWPADDEKERQKDIALEISLNTRPVECIPPRKKI
jgi:hypothetical protein